METYIYLVVRILQFYIALGGGGGGVIKAPFLHSTLIARDICHCLSFEFNIERRTTNDGNNREEPLILLIFIIH